MIPADRPVQRPPDAKLLVVDETGAIAHARRDGFAGLLRPGDLVVANDAATLPASLVGVHEATAAAIELRLAGRASLDADDLAFTAIAFGAGDYRMRTEDRPQPPALAPGDRLALGPLAARVVGLLGHPRLVAVAFDGPPAAFWAGLAHHGRPIQYAYMAPPLALWDVWTPVAGPPVAFEPPSAGFVLSWQALATLRRRGIGFATITHAAGISSTGDDALDRLLPFDEAYCIPARTAAAIARTRALGSRIVAIGTTVVRALEHARGRAGSGVATQRIGPASELAIVDAILSGTHEPGSSHYELLRAFVDDATLARADAGLAAQGYRTHEFGDSVLLHRSEDRVRVAERAAWAAAE
jgi:S-adenosylmethionine:tRNA ribosyltransferase-isomerase